MGFDYCNQQGNYEEAKAALLAQKQILGDLLIVPTNDMSYSEAVRGMKLLGRTVNNIRNNYYYEQHKEELLGMGFVFDIVKKKKKKKKI